MDLSNLDQIELNRSQARAIGNLQRAFQTDFETGAEYFAAAMEELQDLKKYYQEGETMEITQKEAVEKYLAEIVSEEAAHELAAIDGEELTEVYNVLHEQMDYQNLLPEEPTVKSMVQGLSDLSQADFTRYVGTDDEVDLQEFQGMVANQIDCLAGLLGIELEG